MLTWCFWSMFVWDFWSCVWLDPWTKLLTDVWMRIVSLCACIGVPWLVRVSPGGLYWLQGHVIRPQEKKVSLIVPPHLQARCCMHACGLAPGALRSQGHWAWALLHHREYAWWCIHLHCVPDGWGTNLWTCDANFQCYRWFQQIHLSAEDYDSFTVPVCWPSAYRYQSHQSHVNEKILDSKCSWFRKFATIICVSVWAVSLSGQWVTEVVFTTNIHHRYDHHVLTHFNWKSCKLVSKHISRSSCVIIRLPWLNCDLPVSRRILWWQGMHDVLGLWGTFYVWLEERRCKWRGS